MGELIREVLHEIAANPARFAAELVQSAVLVALIVSIGREKLGKRLDGRRARIVAEMAEADAAVQESARIRDEARALGERPPEEGPALLHRAEEEGARQRKAAIAAMEAEAEEILAQARQTVEREKERFSRETGARMAQLTAGTVLRYIDEMFTESERRALTQKAILASLGQMERGAASGQGAS
jgi:F0F1-type ATP synthase membrane subunit b/b'